VVVETKGGADLVGERDRDPPLFERRPRDAGGGGDEEPAPDGAAALCQDFDLGIGREPVAADVDAVPGPGDRAVVVEPGKIRGRLVPGREAARVDAEDFDELLRDLPDQH